MAGNRLDQLLVDRGKYETRARARDAIKRGCVSVDGAVVTKPAAAADPTATITVNDPALHYVSRAALKLIHGLDAFGLDPTGKVCLDVGASTGGFCQVLLERGAAKVFAVDVGHGQLAARLKSNDRLVNLEQLNARNLTIDHLEGERPTCIVSDVSFISLTLALPAALRLAKPGAHCILLVKPQFEVGKDKIGKKGLVEPHMAHETALRLKDWLDGMDQWRSTGLVDSPITGGDGNREFLLAGVKHG